MAIGPLETYDITADRGFLCAFDAPDIELPDAFDEIVDAGVMLPDLLVTGRVRSFLDTLPEVPMADLLPEMSDAERRIAMVRYSFLVQSYVWGEKTVPSKLPACLARPIWELAAAMGQQPLLPYSSYVLDNWGMFDPARGIALDNLYMIQNFIAGMDEAWFVLVHVAIEATAGAALAEVPGLIRAAAEGDAPGATAALATIGSTWEKINAIFDRMPEQCDPYCYFHRVRPYIHGWQDNPALPGGLVYEGVAGTNGKPVAFRGQTGSQSSIVPLMDAALGLTHEQDPLRRYLDELHIYRPVKHRQFIDDIRAETGIRSFVEAQGPGEMREAYNHIVEGIAGFRTRHLEYAASYINKQGNAGAGNDTEVGTGGTPFMKYLKKHRDESRAALIA